MSQSISFLGISCKGISVGLGGGLEIGSALSGASLLVSCMVFLFIVLEIESPLDIVFGITYSGTGMTLS